MKNNCNRVCCRSGVSFLVENKGVMSADNPLCRRCSVNRVGSHPRIKPSKSNDPSQIVSLPFRFVLNSGRSRAVIRMDPEGEIRKNGGDNGAMDMETKKASLPKKEPGNQQTGQPLVSPISKRMILLPPCRTHTL